MDIFYWVIIAAMFLIGFIGLIYPVIPSVLFIMVGFILYGVFYSFVHLIGYFGRYKVCLLSYCLSLTMYLI